MRVSSLPVTICVLVLVTLAACGKRPVTRPDSVLPPECTVLPAPEEIADSITVALLDTVDPSRAPLALNRSERLLFRYLYETLIIVDCFDEVQAGLAESWKSGEGGRRWTFTLRESARFWDGTRVRARDVATSWQDAMTLSTVIDSVGVAGERIVHVYLKEPHRRVPRALSASVFAVTLPSEDSHWLLGSGRYRIVAQTGTLSPTPKGSITTRPAFEGEKPVIRFVETSADDARDLLEGGVDVMVTTDPAVIEYAANHSEYATVALPWDKTYVLLSTSRVHELRTGGTVGTIPPDLLDAIARDAVRGDARGYRSPSWWDDLSGCGELSSDVPGSPSVPQDATARGTGARVLYDLNDGIARDLAERVVALATRDADASPEAAAIASAVPGLARSETRVIAEGVTGGEFRRSLRRGDDFAYVVPISRRPPDPCYEASELIGRAPWLSNPGIDFPNMLIPLLDVRAHVIARRGRFGLMVDGYGNVLIVNETLREK